MVCNGRRDAPQDRRADRSPPVRSENDDPGTDLLSRGKDGFPWAILFAGRRAGVETRGVRKFGTLRRRLGRLRTGFLDQLVGHDGSGTPPEGECFERLIRRHYDCFPGHAQLASSLLDRLLCMV